MNIQVIETEKKIGIVSDYNKTWIAHARKLGGKWDGDKKAWFFDKKKQDIIDDVLLEIFGESPFSDEDVKRVDIKINAIDFVNDDTIRVGTIIVAVRRCRDYAVQLKNGAYVSKGDFPASGGSMKYPCCKPDENVEMIVPNFPLSILAGIDKELYTIIDDEVKQQDELIREKQKLEKRLAEINLLLAM
ncbi:hypothetical protein [Enterococcus sp. DIV0187]|uniref:hypothetical protein n=1 Tax=Enterococcus sp. DIV0187 TaxID=2774644 RepID=UPI003F29801F